MSHRVCMSQVGFHPHPSPLRSHLLTRKVPRVTNRVNILPVLDRLPRQHRRKQQLITMMMDLEILLSSLCQDRLRQPSLLLFPLQLSPSLLQLCLWPCQGRPPSLHTQQAALLLCTSPQMSSEVVLHRKILSSQVEEDGPTSLSLKLPRPHRPCRAVKLPPLCSLLAKHHHWWPLRLAVVGT